jgi:predicted nucleic acid-binding protein
VILKTCFLLQKRELYITSNVKVHIAVVLTTLPLTVQEYFVDEKYAYIQFKIIKPFVVAVIKIISEEIDTMAKKYKIYLDVCCLNRPFDDQTQPRIRLESEAILEIISRCRTGEWELLNSTALESEVARTPDISRREQVQEVLSIAQQKILVNAETSKRAIDITKFGIKNFDALHIACAEDNADVFLTTDNRLLSKALSYSNDLNIVVANPMVWWAEATDNLLEGEEDDPN